jgi:hypothetical protein
MVLAWHPWLACELGRGCTPNEAEVAIGITAVTPFALLIPVAGAHK